MSETDMVGGDNWWNNLPPEEKQKALAAVLRSGTLGQENQLVQQEMQEAMQGSQPTGQRGYGLGGLGVGFENFARGITGGIKGRLAKDAYEKNLQELEKQHGILGGLVGMQPRLQQPMPDGIPPLLRNPNQPIPPMPYGLGSPYGNGGT